VVASFGPCKELVRFTSDPDEALELGLLNWALTLPCEEMEPGVCMEIAADVFDVVITLLTRDTIEEQTLAVVVIG